MKEARDSPGAEGLGSDRPVGPSVHTQPEGKGASWTSAAQGLGGRGQPRSGVCLPVTNITSARVPSLRPPPT